MPVTMIELCCDRCGAHFLRAKGQTVALRKNPGAKVYCSHACRRQQRPIADRLWENVAVGSTDECWEWTGWKNKRGYVSMLVGGRKGHTVGVHRLAWEQANGPIPPGVFICHACDNPCCCNPSHLFSGTPSDNVQDMLSKGRHFTPALAGKNNGRAKLNESQVAEIREGKLQTMEYAAKFGVDRSTVRRVALGKRYQ